MPISRAESLSVRYPFSTPFSISTVSCVGEPSSSTLSDPRRPRHGSVVHHRHQRAGHRPAHQARKCRRPLAVEVRLKPVAHRLMQQDSRPARPQHHFHFARRRRHRAQLQNRSARCFLRQVFRALCSRQTAPAPRGRPRPPIRWSSFRRLSLAITDTLSRASGCVSLANDPSDPATNNPPNLFRVIRPDLRDARIVSPRRAIRPQNQFQPRRQVQIESAHRHRVQIGRRRLRKSLHRLLRRPGAISAAVLAACISRSAFRLSVYAYPVRSPLITRMPQPALVPWLADFTICSSTPSEIAITDSKYKSA